MNLRFFCVVVFLCAAGMLYGYEALGSMDIAYGYEYENSDSLLSGVNQTLALQSIGLNIGLQLYFPELSNNVGLFFKYSYMFNGLGLSGEPEEYPYWNDMEVSVNDMSILVGPAFRSLISDAAFFYICPGFQFQHISKKDTIIVSHYDTVADRYGMGADIGFGVKLANMGGGESSFGIVLGVISAIYFVSNEVITVYPNITTILEKSGEKQNLLCFGIKPYIGFLLSRP